MSNVSAGFLTGTDGANDNDVLIEVEVAQYDTFILQSTQGAMDVVVSLDGTNYATAPLSLTDMGAVSSDPVIVTAANRTYGFRGKFRKVKVLQNGATAVQNPVLAYGTMS